MSTTNASVNTAPKTFPCTVDYSWESPIEWLSVTSVSKGGIVELELKDAGLWDDAFTPAQIALLVRLSNEDNGATVNLTAEEMREVLTIRTVIGVIVNTPKPAPVVVPVAVAVPVASFNDRISQAMWEDDQPIAPVVVAPVLTYDIPTTNGNPAPKLHSITPSPVVCLVGPVAPVAAELEPIPAPVIEQIAAEAKPIVNDLPIPQPANSDTVISVPSAVRAAGSTDRKVRADYKIADNHERELRRLEKVADIISKGGFYQLTYDIPTVLSERNEVPNPSDRLWECAAFMNKSTRLIAAENRTHPVLLELIALWDAYADMGVTYSIHRFHPDEDAAMLVIAKNNIDKRIRAIHTSLINTIANADRQLEEALAIVGPMTEKEVKKVQDYRDNRVRAELRTATQDTKNVAACAEVFNRAADSLNAAIASAERYDDTMNVEDALAGLRSAVSSLKDTFNASMRLKGKSKLTV